MFVLLMLNSFYVAVVIQCPATFPIAHTTSGFYILKCYSLHYNLLFHEIIFNHNFQTEMGQRRALIC